MDTVDKATRSYIMSQVGQKNTGAELMLRKALHKIGLRYRLSRTTDDGNPNPWSRVKSVAMTVCVECAPPRVLSVTLPELRQGQIAEPKRQRKSSPNGFSSQLLLAKVGGRPHSSLPC